MERETHIRYVNGSAVEVPSHGGSKARAWRRQVALAGKAGSRAPAPPMKTLVFPLQAQIPTDFYSVSAAHYATVEGIGVGSLYQLLMRVHLAGLRPYGSEKEAAAARNAAQFPNDAFRAAVEAHFGSASASVTPQSLFAQFQKVPRAKNGIKPVFDVDAVANWLHVGFWRRSMSDATDAGVRGLLQLVAETVVASVKDYSDLARQASAVLARVGEALRQIDEAFPDLRIDCSDRGPASPLAYTGEVRPVEAHEPPEYWLHHVVACLLLADPGRSETDVQNLVLSPSNNALSQLFGKMIDADGQLCQGDADTLRRALGVPADRLQQVADLMAAARAVPRPQMFAAEKHYANYRPHWGGRIRSWIANYLQRLETLRSQLDQLAAAEGGQTAPDQTDDLLGVLQELGWEWSEFQGLFRTMAEAVGEARVCVAVLRGLDESMRPVAAARTLEERLREIERMRGICQQVVNQLKQRQASEPDAVRDRWIAYLDRFGSAGVFALPRIGWGAQDAQADLAEVNQQLHRLLDAVQAIRGLATGDSLVDMRAYLQGLYQDEARRGREAASAAQGRVVDYADLARRRFLQSLVGLARRLSPQPAGTVWNWLRPLIQHSPGGRAVAADKVFNRLRFNAQGRLYVSPWSHTRHQAIFIDERRFAECDWSREIESLRNAVAEALRTAPSAQTLQDYIEVERFAAQMAVTALCEPLPQHALLARVDVAALQPYPDLYKALQAPQIERRTLARLLALVDSHFSRLRFVLRRSAFVVRHKFARIGQDELLLVPKARQWTPPAKYFDGNAPIAQALRASALFQRGQGVDAAAAFRAAAALPLGRPAGALLKQIPHDLYVDLGLQPPVGDAVEAVVLSKALQAFVGSTNAVGASPGGGRTPQWTLRRTRAVRLVGASSFTNRMTDALIGRVLINEWTLVLDWVYASSVVVSDGRPSVSARLIECRPKIAVPITPQGDEGPSVSLFERFVAIDLGERQIGYAVFDARAALASEQPLQPITDPLTNMPAVGAVRVPGVRRLIRSVKVHRARQSGISKVRDRYDRYLQELRDVVTGQVAHIIESLCARFNAFPVLESSVTHFQTGSRQLDLVYGNVVRLYTYSPDADAHNQRRAEHWMGADKWTHPYLMALPFDREDQGTTKKSMPLNLFPGTSISPKGTSQRCIHCLRNPVEAFRRLEAKVSKGKIAVEPNGIVRLDDGAVHLMRGMRYTEPELKAARRDKRNLPLNDPLPPGEYEPREVLAAIKRTMRQKWPNQRAKDTTQSRYQCLYTDCGQSYHADAGAAINIGRKFFADKIDREASRQALDRYIKQCRQAEANHSGDTQAVALICSVPARHRSGAAR